MTKVNKRLPREAGDRASERSGIAGREDIPRSLVCASLRTIYRILRIASLRETTKSAES